MKSWIYSVLRILDRKTAPCLYVVVDRLSSCIIMVAVINVEIHQVAHIYLLLLYVTRDLEEKYMYIVKPSWRLATTCKCDADCSFI